VAEENAENHEGGGKTYDAYVGSSFSGARDHRRYLHRFPSTRPHSGFCFRRSTFPLEELEVGTLRNIQEFIRSPIFSSSARVGILLYLMGVEKTSFTDLLKGIGLPKSSLYLHLKVLEENGAISMRETLFRGRPRTVIQELRREREW